MNQPLTEDRVKELIHDEMGQNDGEQQFAVSTTPYHLHNGSDSPTVNFNDLGAKYMVIPYTLFGTTASTDTNYSVFFTAPFAITIKQITEVHAVKGTDGSAVTLDIEKLTGTTAPGSGTKLTVSPFDLKGTINTVVTGVLSSTVGVIQLATGDRLALRKTGTLTSVANVTVTLIVYF